MRVLITGGCGFLGSNLSSFFLKNNDQVFVIDALYRKGSLDNLNWLKKHKSNKNLYFFKADISNNNFVDSIFNNNGPFDYVCHVAGQVAMTKSLKDPRSDLMTNVLGTFNILEALRKFSPQALLAFSSTNKVYGDLDWIKIREESKRYVLEGFEKGLNEEVPLDFSTPYGCSKGSADQYVRDWARVYGLKTVVFRHSSIYGGRQFASYDQGWIGWFCQKAIEQKNNSLKNLINEPFTISGTGKQVRDVLHSDDLVSLYHLAYLNKDKLNGEIFNIGGGHENSLSILELFDLLEKNLELDQLIYEKIKRRDSDQNCFIASIEKAKSFLDWYPKVNKEEGISNMLEWCKHSIIEVT